MPDDIKKILERGVEEIIDSDHLAKRLNSGEKLRVKLGIDPTAKNLHLGHTVVLRKLRQFQDAGHQAVFIIGDFTATIGDPSGRNELRPELTGEQIKENMKEYLKEAGKVLDIKKTEVRYNSEWLGNKNGRFLMELASKFTVARSLERDDFQKRLKENRDISVLELLYPILQGYDSVEIKADVELGGTDQKFNLLMGRKVQKKYGLPEQDIMTLPLIEGTDGVKKMSKSLNNYIGLSDEPNEMFGKVMAIPDDLMTKYYTLLTDLDPDLASKDPKTRKIELATELVRMYHGETDAQKAADNFKRVFSEKGTPEDIKTVALASDANIIEAIIAAELAPSRTEAKRLVDQGAVDVNGERIDNWEHKTKSGDIIKVGAHRFVKIK